MPLGRVGVARMPGLVLGRRRRCCGSGWTGGRAGRGSCVGLVVLVAVAAGFVGAAGGALGGGDGVVAGGWLLVGVGQWGEGAAQVPDEVLGEHADQDVSFDAVGESVVDGPQVKVVDFDVAPVAFHIGQVFVGDDHVGGVEVCRRLTLVRMT